ncbi:TetR/AcrR family transcriptional regulator [Agrococcus sp. KRD186]|uniref:TetR/AcrR family transcriptional regulator n=1 Tax=Agrococcus sp. KRD186 TaxID=2729730 RepID=UPI003144F57F
MSRSAPYHHGNLAETLERAALALLETHTAAALSLREVARQAGVSHNAPYHHFGDRQGLLKRVAERAMAELLAAQQRAAEAAQLPRERLLAVGAAYVEHALAHPNAFAVIFDPDVCEPGHPTEAMAVSIRANEDLLTDAVAAFRPESSAEQTSLFGAALWGAVHGLATLATAGHLPREALRPALDALLPRD